MTLRMVNKVANGCSLVKSRKYKRFLKLLFIQISNSPDFYLTYHRPKKLRAVSAMEVHNDRGTLEEASFYIRDITQWTNRRPFLPFLSETNGYRDNRVRSCH